MGLDTQEVANQDTKGIFKWFLRKFLEGQTWKFVKAENWDAFYIILALLVHGIMLFLNINHFVDHLAVEIFLLGNLMPFLLVDIYHTLHTRHEKRGGTFICCTPLLHAWMMTHMPKEGPFVSKDLKWPQRPASLTFSTIKWYKREWETKYIILICGEFLNVPLMGTWRCINYNPVLHIRQFGHAMKGPSEDKYLETFVIHDITPSEPSVKKVRKAWLKISRSGQKIGKKNVIAREAYIWWVKERVQVIKIPFIFKFSSFPLVHELEPISMEEVKELRAKVQKLELENS